MKRTTQRIYRPELDLLRFLAFLAVFLHHTLPVNTTGALMRYRFLVVLPAIQEMLGFGLCLFFFLSSYLITCLLEVEKARTGSIHLKKFYIRRILRIWPLYFAFLGAMYLLGLRWAPAAIEPGRLAALSLLAGNWFSIYFGMGSMVISHLWSISVEEQFYLVWPSVSRLLQVRQLFAVCWTICLVCLGATWVLGARGDSSLAIWLNSIVQSLFFASGGLLALTIGIRRQTKSPLRAALAGGAGLSLWFAAARFSGITDRVHAIVPWRGTLGYAMVAAGCALLLWGFLHLPDWLLPAPLVYLGRISYGLYVFHALVLAAARALGFRDAVTLRTAATVLIVKFLITIVIAALAYEFFEKPFLRLKTRFELIHTRPA